MVAAVTDAVSKPVTVKMRTGWDEDHIYAVQNALAAERGGAAALAMHGRTRKQLYSGHADWNILKEVKQHLSIPFIGNGDVRTHKMPNGCLMRLAPMQSWWAAQH